MPDNMPSVDFSDVEFLQDFNADGLPDLVLQADYSASVTSHGDGDTYVLIWDGYEFSVTSNIDGTDRRFDNVDAFGDFDGDGLMDMFNGGSTDGVHWGSGSIPHLLTAIRTPLGAKIEVAYTPSTDSDGFNDDFVFDDRIPGTRQLVSSVTLSDDHWNEPRTTEYRYRDGNWDYVWNRSLGFSSVDTILPAVEGQAKWADHLNLFWRFAARGCGCARWAARNNTLVPCG